MARRTATQQRSVASDELTESAVWKLRGVLRDLQEMGAESVFERVQVGRVRDAVRVALDAAQDARDILREAGR